MTKINIPISTMLSDVKAYMETLTFSNFASYMGQESSTDKKLFNSVKVWKKQSFPSLIKWLASGVVSTPALIVIPSGSDREKSNCRGKNTTTFALLVLGTFNADGYDEGVQDFADYVIEQFMPVAEEPSVRCTRRGVVYEPTGWDPVELPKSHTDAVVIRLEATDARRPLEQRTDSLHFTN